jgi:hypothetical protein
MRYKTKVQIFAIYRVNNSNYEVSKLINFRSVRCSWQYLILSAYCRDVAFLMVINLHGDELFVS